MANLTYHCRVIPPGKPFRGTLVRIEPGDPAPAFFGAKDDPGDLDLLCGSCGTVIAREIWAESLTDFVIQCRCGAYNDTNTV